MNKQGFLVLRRQLAAAVKRASFTQMEVVADAVSIELGKAQSRSGKARLRGLKREVTRELRECCERKARQLLGQLDGSLKDIVRCLRPESVGPKKTVATMRAQLQGCEQILICLGRFDCLNRMVPSVLGSQEDQHVLLERYAEQIAELQTQLDRAEHSRAKAVHQKNARHRSNKERRAQENRRRAAARPRLRGKRGKRHIPEGQLPYDLP